MANPRDLAEQAFALLQNALQESEARASELDEELKRKRTPKNRIEEQLDVLTHRLENVEAERTRWEQQAGHLEEVAEAERAKVAQLKKKLEVAESGPEKLTKKEINFWRAKAESIDVEIKEYKDRLAGLRRELNERDAQIEKLQAAAGASPEAPRPEPAPAPDAAVADLRRQLEQRDEWLAELRLELHEVRSRPAPPLEVQAEVETLRSQIVGLERALADAHTARATAQANAARFEQDLSERERAIRDANAAGERAREALAQREHAIREATASAERAREAFVERDTAIREATAELERARETLVQREHRLVELTAEVEQLRAREAQQRDDNARNDEQVHALSLEIEALRATIDQERQDAAAATMALRDTLNDRDREIANQRELLATNETDFRRLREEISQRDAALDDHRSRIAERDAALDDYRNRLTESAQAANDARRDLDEQRAELEERDRKISAAFADLEHARATVAANDRELASLRETLLSSSRELDELRAHKQRLEQICEDAAARATAAQNDLAAAREQLAGLEAELKEEREHGESLGELANERREHMTKLQEQLEEAEERYADANWRLGKSLHHERIVKRRKGLVLKLLEALRGKMKANTALKAGLDGLRTFKAASEINQQKLLQRVDTLKTELREAHEAIKRHQGGTAASEELANAVARATSLEQRLNTQAELIQTLEADLKKAKLAHKTPAPADDKNAEVERLTQELATKNELITRLQADSDEQQKKLAKLRGSESETMRLKAVTDKDRNEIDALQREVAQLREALTRQANSGNADLEAKLKETQQSVTRLMGTIKEHESTIKKLTESSDSWKRKYQFLASDAPDAHKNAAEK
jgi:chromosome segregation ATPase